MNRLEKMAQDDQGNLLDLVYIEGANAVLDEFKKYMQQKMLLQDDGLCQIAAAINELREFRKWLEESSDNA